MGIHWYQPKRWTLGLLLRHLRWQQRRRVFSLSIAREENQLEERSRLEQ